MIPAFFHRNCPCAGEKAHVNPILVAVPTYNKPNMPATSSSGDAGDESTITAVVVSIVVVLVVGGAVGFYVFKKKTGGASLKPHATFDNPAAKMPAESDSGAADVVDADF